MKYNEENRNIVNISEINDYYYYYYRISVAKLALMFLFYFNFNINLLKASVNTSSHAQGSKFLYSPQKVLVTLWF